MIQPRNDYKLEGFTEVWICLVQCIQKHDLRLPGRGLSEAYI